MNVLKSSSCEMTLNGISLLWAAVAKNINEINRLVLLIISRAKYVLKL
jgi:hypothetical protein